MSNIYLTLTEQFNRGRLRAIISSGQAVVLHRLAIMSKDGDWVLREDEESMQHVLTILEQFGARYRFGAPLDTRWLGGGWSAHLEFRHNNLRVRTDFTTRPPRIDAAALERLWRDTNPQRAVLDVTTLAQIKKTNREKDYAVIGELARLMDKPRDQLLYSRSARDLIKISQSHPTLVRELGPARPLLNEIERGRTRLEQALDAERRALIHANEQRLAAIARPLSSGPQAGLRSNGPSATPLFAKPTEFWLVARWNSCHLHRKFDCAKRTRRIPERRRPRSSQPLRRGINRLLESVARTGTDHQPTGPKQLQSRCVRNGPDS